MLLETAESFVQQLMLHKHRCNGDLAEGNLIETRFRYRCGKCLMKWEINDHNIYQTVWRYVRGGDRQVFHEFLKLDLSNHTGKYGDFFIVYQVMQS
jgi:hypothetical protein